MSMPTEKISGTARTNLREKFKSKTPQFPQRIRRCYMTGKQCIFCSQTPSSQHTQIDIEPKGVFVIMPFRPNLDTFYEWSLKRYIESGLEIEEKEIRRADEFRNIGYVMCEKICRRIQEAELVVVDFSVDNPNVFYEFGLAVGLNKPILIICDNQLSTSNGRAKDFWKSLGIPFEEDETGEIPKCVVIYPSVGFLSSTINDIVKMSRQIPLKPLKADRLKILALLTQEKTVEEIPKEGNDSIQEDIDVDFHVAVEAAIGVAIDNIKNNQYKLSNLSRVVKIWLLVKICG
jgi:hypothetical protein